MPHYVFIIMHFYVRVYYFRIVYFHARTVILFTCFLRFPTQMKRLNFPSSIEYGQVLADNSDNNGQENDLVILLCLHE